MQEIWRIFVAGGHVMWFLLACSIFAVAIGVQRLHFFSKISPKGKVEEELTQLLRNCRWDEASLVAQNNASMMSAVLSRSFQFENQKDRERVFQGEATTLIHRMHEGLRYLDTIVTLSPLLGLLGTVLGMIQSFQVLSVKEGKIDVITGGVAEALVATAFGLIVAVLALCIHSYLSFRLDREATTLEEWGNLIQQTTECSL